MRNLINRCVLARLVLHFSYPYMKGGVIDVRFLTSSGGKIKIMTCLPDRKEMYVVVSTSETDLLL
jgi:hypothetical protein